MAKKKKWTKHTLRKEALKYKTRTEFAKANNSAYKSAHNYKCIDEICEHMPTTYSAKQYKMDIPVNTKGIYLLYTGFDIMYVGKSSKCISDRVRQHLKTRNEVTSISAYQILNKADMDIAEVYLINKYKPKWNIDCNSQDIPTLVLSDIDKIILQEFHVNVLTLNR